MIQNTFSVTGYQFNGLKEEPVKELALLSRRVAADGIVLIKNDNQVLPLKKNGRISIFGRMQSHYVKSGTGSGGLVNVEYVTNILDSFRNHPDIVVNETLADIYAKWTQKHPVDLGKGWATEPWSQAEMPLSDADAKNAADVSDVAIVIIARTAGEDKDNTASPGGYFLTDTERNMLKTVRAHFKKVCAILNVGNIIDMSWVSECNIDAVLYVWQGGMEGGNAAVDVLCGTVTPGGKLSDTIAYQLSDYPSDQNFGGDEENIYREDIYVGYRYFETFAKDAVLYPFGFGLSYTRFDVNTKQVCAKDGTIEVEVFVTNTGDYAGREVVQVYFGAPQGKLGKPAKELIGFAKTKTLAKNETERITIRFDISDMASYDDGGATGNRSCYVLEEGAYDIYVGTDARNAKKEFEYKVEALIVTKQLSEALTPVKKFTRMRPAPDPNGGFRVEYEDAPVRTVDLNERILRNLPEEAPKTGDQGIKLLDVYEGRKTMEEFIAQLSDEDLACISRGEGMNSPKVTPGTGCAFGGVTDSLLHFGIPVACGTDGPSGIRMDSGNKATSMPNGTLIACTWDLKLAEELYVLEGVELAAYKIDALLGPGINIHRHPLNGRNFEYFSEDPYLTGEMGAAITRGIAKAGVTGTLKHFAANNQEKGRHSVDSVVSERALREIYLKAFEIGVKTGNAKAIMTSYNPLNGIWTAGSYDLNTTILRNEWHYGGFVMTDWWAKINDEGEDGNRENIKAMVRAQNDIYMVTNDAANHPDNIIASLENGSLTIGELQRNAKNICAYLIHTHAFNRLVANGGTAEYSKIGDWEGLSEIYCLDEVIANKEYEMAVPQSGKYFMRVELESGASALAQIPFHILINDHSAATLTANGTEGKTVAQIRELSLMKGSSKLKFSFASDLLKIKKIELRK